jgi:hypothetical protein
LIGHEIESHAHDGVLGSGFRVRHRAGAAAATAAGEPTAASISSPDDPGLPALIGTCKNLEIDF